LLGYGSGLNQKEEGDSYGNKKGINHEKILDFPKPSE